MRGGVRKPAAKKAPGAVVTKRVQLRGRGSSRAEAAPCLNRSREDELESEEEVHRPDQQHDRQPEQSAPRHGERLQLQPASRKRKSVAACSGGGGSQETILSLTAEALQEVFKCLGQQQSYCR